MNNVDSVHKNLIGTECPQPNWHLISWMMSTAWVASDVALRYLAVKYSESYLWYNFVGDARPDWSHLLVIKRLMTDIGLETQDASDDLSKFLSSQHI